MDHNSGEMFQTLNKESTMGTQHIENDMLKNVDYERDIYKLKAKSPEGLQKNVNEIDRILELPAEQRMKLTDEQIARLEVLKGRNLSALFVEEKKFGGDSDDMMDVKRSVTVLESGLKDEYVTGCVQSVKDHYEMAIAQCVKYCENKNPIFATGKKRKRMVEETLARLREELKQIELAEQLMEQGNTMIEVKTIEDLFVLARMHMSVNSDPIAEMDTKDATGVHSLSFEDFASLVGTYNRGQVMFKDGKMQIVNNHAYQTWDSYELVNLLTGEDAERTVLNRQMVERFFEVAKERLADTNPEYINQLREQITRLLKVKEGEKKAGMISRKDLVALIESVEYMGSKVNMLVKARENKENEAKRNGTDAGEPTIEETLAKQAKDMFIGNSEYAENRKKQQSKQKDSIEKVLKAAKKLGVSVPALSTHQMDNITHGNASLVTDQIFEAMQKVYKHVNRLRMERVTEFSLNEQQRTKLAAIVIARFTAQTEEGKQLREEELNSYIREIAFEIAEATAGEEAPEVKEMHENYDRLNITMLSDGGSEGLEDLIERRIPTNYDAVRMVREGKPLFKSFCDSFGRLARLQDIALTDGLDDDEALELTKLGEQIQTMLEDEETVKKMIPVAEGLKNTRFHKGFYQVFSILLGGKEKFSYKEAAFNLALSTCIHTKAKKEETPPAAPDLDEKMSLLDKRAVNVTQVLLLEELPSKLVQRDREEGTDTGEAAKSFADLRHVLRQFPTGRVYSKSVKLAGVDGKLVQKNDNTLYFVVNNQAIPLTRTAQQLANTIEDDMMAHTELYGEGFVRKLVDDMDVLGDNKGLLVRSRTLCIKYLSGKTGKPDTFFNNIHSIMLKKYVEDLINGKGRTEQDIIDEVDMLNETIHLNGQETLELIEQLEQNEEQQRLLRQEASVEFEDEKKVEEPVATEKEKEETKEPVVTEKEKEKTTEKTEEIEATAQETEEEVETQKEEEEEKTEWSPEEKEVQNLIADMIFSEETWKADRTSLERGRRMQIMLLEHKKALSFLSKNDQSLSEILDAVMVPEEVKNEVILSLRKIFALAGGSPEIFKAAAEVEFTEKEIEELTDPKFIRSTISGMGKADFTEDEVKTGLKEGFTEEQLRQNGLDIFVDQQDKFDQMDEKLTERMMAPDYKGAALKEEDFERVLVLPECMELLIEIENQIDGVVEDCAETIQDMIREGAEEIFKSKEKDETPKPEGEQSQETTKSKQAEDASQPQQTTKSKQAEDASQPQLTKEQKAAAEKEAAEKAAAEKLAAEKAEAARKLEESKKELEELLKDASNGAEGQGLFMKNVLSNYFVKVSRYDQRAMLASAVRNAKPKSKKKLDGEAKEAQERERMGELLSGYLKGAGPLLHKMLQGMPDVAIPKELEMALKDMKSNLAPIPRHIVRAQMQNIIERSNGKINKINITRALGAASVGQTFLCRVFGPEMPEGKDVVVKLLRPDVSNRMMREKTVMIACARMTDLNGRQESEVPEGYKGGMQATYEGQLLRIEEELDLTIEARNAQKGSIYDKGFKTVKAMKVDSIVEPTANSLVLEKAPGTTIDKFLDETKKKKEEILGGVLQVDENGACHLTEAYRNRTGIPYQEYVSLTKKREELKEILAQLQKRQKYLTQICESWVVEGIYGEGFYHGDLHAGNIMVDDNGLTVIDFGNATSLDEKQQTHVTRMVMGAAIGKADIFLESFHALLENTPEDVYEAKKDKLLEIFTKIFSLGDMSSSGQRIAAALLKAQTLGIEVPPAIFNFSQSQLRLQNTVDSMNAQITALQDAYTVMDSVTLAANDQYDTVYQTYLNSRAKSQQDREKTINDLVEQLEFHQVDEEELEEVHQELHEGKPAVWEKYGQKIDFSLKEYENYKKVKAVLHKYENYNGELTAKQALTEEDYDLFCKTGHFLYKKLFKGTVNLANITQKKGDEIAAEVQKVLQNLERAEKNNLKQPNWCAAMSLWEYYGEKTKDTPDQEKLEKLENDFCEAYQMIDEYRLVHESMEMIRVSIDLQSGKEALKKKTMAAKQKEIDSMKSGLGVLLDNLEKDTELGGNQYAGPLKALFDDYTAYIEQIIEEQKTAPSLDTITEQQEEELKQKQRKFLLTIREMYVERYKKLSQYVKENPDMTKPEDFISIMGSLIESNLKSSIRKLGRWTAFKYREHFTGAKK